MNDDNAETHDLNAIAAFPRGTGYVLCLMDETGELHTSPCPSRECASSHRNPVNCVQGLPVVHPPSSTSSASEALY